MKHSIKAYIVGNEEAGYKVMCRQFTKLLFQIPCETLAHAQRTLNQLEGVRIEKTHSHHS